MWVGDLIKSLWASALIGVHSRLKKCQTTTKKIIKHIISPANQNREFKKLYVNALKLPKALVLNSFKNMTCKFTLKRELVQIHQPTLIIYGTEDKITPKSMVNTLNDLIPRSELRIVENGSHRVMYDNYKKVNEFIDEFINK